MGLIDHLAAVKLLRETNIEGRNRLSLILLDSALEIGFKQYLIYEKGIDLQEPALTHRDKLEKIMKNNSSFDDDTWKQIDFYYDERCGAYHKEAEKTLTEPHIEKFFDLVIKVFNRLFGMDSMARIPSLDSMLPTSMKPVDLSKLNKPIDLIVVAVQNSKSKSSVDIRKALERLGCKKKLAPSKIAAYLNSQAYHNLFYKDEETGVQKLSDAGRLHYEKLQSKI